MRLRRLHVDHTEVACKRLLPVLVVLMVFALTACDDNAITPPTGSSELILRIEADGGFVPIEYSLMQTPSFSLYGDGTVIVTGPMIEIYPQPALPNLQQTTITQDDIDKILVAAREAGLFGNEVDYGTPNVTDLPTTTITVNADGETFVSNIYALGFEHSFGDTSSDNIAMIGLTPEQVQARTAVWDFTVKASGLDDFLGTPLEWQQYEFTALAVYSLPVDPDTGTDADSIQPNHLDWPLGDLSVLGEPTLPDSYRRLVVSGADLDGLKPLLDQANRITLWKSGDGEYHLYFRPLLPDENA